MAFFFMAPFVCTNSLLIKLCIKVWHFSSSTDVGDSIFCWGNWLFKLQRVDVSHVSRFSCFGRLPVWNISWVIPQCPPSVPEILEFFAIIYRFTKNKGKALFFVGPGGHRSSKSFFCQRFRKNSTLQVNSQKITLQLARIDTSKPPSWPLHTSHILSGGNASSICEWTC